MNISRATLSVTMILFLSGIGADNCGAYWPSAPAGPPPSSANKPFCQFDPPVGCKAFCPSLGVVDFTEQCKDISASTLTVAFVNAVDDSVAKAAALGRQACNQDDLDAHVTVTPCGVGITPQPNPPESQDVCMNPLPGCVQW